MVEGGSGALPTKRNSNGPTGRLAPTRGPWGTMSNKPAAREEHYSPFMFKLSALYQGCLAEAHSIPLQAI